MSMYLNLVFGWMLSSNVIDNGTCGDVPHAIVWVFS